MIEEIYLSIKANALRDFGNVFRSSFLRTHEHQMHISTHITKEPIDGCDTSKYKTDNGLIVVYDYEPGSNKSLVFKFAGDGKVVIDKIIGVDESTKTSTVVNCVSGGNSVRRQVLHRIYRDLGVDIAELGDLWGISNGRNLF